MTKSNTYNPPYTITQTILNLVADITECVGHITAKSIPLHLRKANKARTIHSSLAIENNTLSLEQVSKIIDGKNVSALQREIDEVKNAAACYELITKLDPCSLADLLKAHSVMMSGLVKDAGKFRTKGVGVFKGDVVVHMAPPAENVRFLVERLLGWLDNAEIHPLIASSAFHYEFEFIHPFPDGNGRLGRFWQSLILSKWHPMLAYLPVESVIYENQEEYYAALSQSDASSDATVFIEFMLKAILKSIRSLAVVSDADTGYSENIEKLLLILGEKRMSAAEIMEKMKLSHRTNFRKNYLLPAINAGLVLLTDPDKPNSPRQKYYRS